jgi:hypothetical protein
MNVVRRKGAPLTVRDEATGIVYEEGHDFAPVTDPHLDFLLDPRDALDSPASGKQDSRGRAVARELLSRDHHLQRSNFRLPLGGQRRYEIWKEQFPLIEKVLFAKALLPERR